MSGVGAGSGTDDLRESLASYLRDPGSFQDPYPLLEQAQAELGPVVESSSGVWAVLGFEEVEAVLTDPTFSRGLSAEIECKAIEGSGGDGAAAAEVFRRWFFNMDAPDHTRLRRLTGPAFRPSAVARFVASVEEITGDLIDEILEAREVDFLDAFAYQLPHRVICRMLGVPEGDHDQWGRWLHTIMEGNRTTIDDGVDDLRAAFEGFGAYCRALLHDRSGSLGEGLISDLLEARDEPEGMTESELVSTLSLLVIAGHETTVHLISNGLFCLLERPEQWRALQSDPEAVSSAVEECLRFEPSARIRPRTTRTVASLGDASIPPGASVQPLVGAANRDPRRFDLPHVFDITRNRPPHLTFGFGAHYCLGAPVARLEAGVAFRELARRADIAMVEVPRWRHAAHRSLERLDVEVRPRRDGVDRR